MGEYAEYEIDRLIDGWLAYRRENWDIQATVSREIRLLRMQAHESFDRIWKRGHMSRGKAYLWLALDLDLLETGAHMKQITDPDVLLHIIEISDEFIGASVAQEDFPDDL